MLASFVLAGCGLEARPVEPTRGSTDADRIPSAQISSGSSTDLAAFAASEQGAPVGALDPQRLRAISRRAIDEMTTTHRGFLPSIAAVSACYDQLAHDDFEARLYCLQLDAVAWFVESSAPPAWQQLDAASNDYFTDERFYERRWREAPPFSDSAEARVQKQALLAELDAAIAAALREYIEAIASDSSDMAAPAPSTPSLQTSKPTP